MVMPRYNLTKKRLKKIPETLRDDIAAEAKALLHAHRDCLRNLGKDTAKIAFDVRDGYYGEAFGLMRALQILGYGYFGSSNLDAHRESMSGYGPKNEDGKYLTNITQPHQNLRWWFGVLEREVLNEEGFDKDNRCEYCLGKYRKDTKSIIEREVARGMVEETQQR